MRKMVYPLLAVMLTLSLCAGCAGKPPDGSGSSAPSPEASSAPEEQHIQLTEAHKELYATYLRPLGYSGQLVGLEPLPPSSDCGIVKDLEVVDAVLDGDFLTLTAEVYGAVLLNPDTGKEIIDNGFWVENTIAIRPPADDPHYPNILLGTAVVKLRDSTPEPAVDSCIWQPIENPGRRVLEEASDSVADQLAASPKPDLSRYDRRLVNYLYRVIRSRRQIGSIDEITLWDLENLCTDLSIDHEVVEAVYDEERNEYIAQPLDAELLRLIPTLRSFSCYYPLTDYSVFEGMDQLDGLYFYIEAEATPLDFSTLRVGHTKTLSIDGFRQDIALNLSGCRVDHLYINSWVAAVTQLRGGDTVRDLEFRNTRSDTRIINAEAFPNLKTLQMDFMSDYARVRDFSQLATFGEDVRIDLALRYQACNDKTVASLAGVRLDSLTLDPESGEWPLENQPDPALVEQINAKDVTWVQR